MCDFITQSSTLPFLEQFSNTVVVVSAKVYLGAHSGLLWKRNYPHITTKGKLSQKLHCHVWMQLTELHVSLQWSVCSHNFLEICNLVFYSAMNLTVTKEISTVENWKEAFLETSWWCVNLSHRVTLCFMEQSINTVFEEAEKGFLGSHWGLRW